MPFEISVRRTFCAAHRLRLPGGGEEAVHGHNWHVAVVVSRDDGGLDAMDCVCDFHDVDAALAEVVGPWDSGDLNADPHFAAEANPSAERVAEAVGRRLGDRLAAGARVVEARVTEAERCEAVWRP